jgi:hypothetical protein
VDEAHLMLYLDGALLVDLWDELRLPDPVWGLGHRTSAVCQAAASHAASPRSRRKAPATTDFGEI